MYVAIAGAVVNRRSVLLRNFVVNGIVSASNPLLHIHANRYGQAKRTAHYRINRKYFDIFGIVSIFGNILILTDKYGETNRSNIPETS